MKRPAFQFYPADWRKDMALQSCSVAARGLWIDLLCIAHECEPYGHLTVNGRAMTSAQIGRHTGLTARECDALLLELADAGVLSRTDEGVIFSRRMVRDEDLRNRRASGGAAGAEHGVKGAEAGSKGGRPKADKGGSETPLTAEQKPPPSSSSSSSPSGSPPVSSKPPGGARTASRGSRLPPGWDPGDSGMAFARQQGLANGKAQGELAKFRDHWAAKTGQDASKADWMAAWRNWVRKAVEFGAGGDAGRGAELEAERTQGVLREMDEAREASQTPEARAAAKRARDLALSAIGRSA